MSYKWKEGRLVYTKGVLRKKHMTEEEREKTEERMREYRRNWNEEHKEELKKYREKNKEKKREYDKKYGIKNRKERSKYYINRLRICPTFRLSCNMRKAIYLSIRDKKEGRHWEDIVGFTVKELMIRLESLFINGMAWDNYGEWHIDHIIPISHFNYSSYEDPAFRKCWRLRNLQPLWAKDNFSKGNRYRYDLG